MPCSAQDTSDVSPYLCAAAIVVCVCVCVGIQKIDTIIYIVS